MIHKETFEAAATLMGFTIGAGILGVPFVIAQAGFLTAIPILIGVAILTLYLNLAAAEVSLRTDGDHQFPALVKKYLGNKWSKLMLIDVMILAYGALTAYTIGGGEIVTDLFGGDIFYNSILFGIILAILVLMNINFFEDFESIFMILLILTIIGIGILSWGHIDINNLTHFEASKAYIPLATILFALFGTSSVPELKEELKSLKNMKLAIIIGTGTITVIYLIFAAIVIGVTGSTTTQVASVGISQSLGEGGKLLFSVFALIALITSYVGMGFVLKDTFHLDLGFKKNSAWLMTIIIPLAIYLSGFVSFIKILNIVGVIHAILLTYITFNLLRAAKLKSERQPEFSLKTHPFIELLVYIVLVIGGVMVLFF